MRLKVFIWTTLSVLVAVAGPAMAQDPAPQDTRPGGVGQPSEPPNTPAPSNDTPPPSDTPSSPETMPVPVP